MTEPLRTILSPYNILRAEGNEDAATVAGLIDLTAKGNFANKSEELTPIDIAYEGNLPPGITKKNKVQIIICGGNAANDTFEYGLYAWRNMNGPAEFMASGAGVLGTQAVIAYPHGGAATNKFWADKLTVTSRWLGGKVKSTDISGNNEVAKLFFDFYGYRYLAIGLAVCDGSTGIEAGDLTAYWAFL